ncbi:hypothetical protein ISN44_As12g030180 [Arabidopsis suecica]|uniref:Uncharacterized protein n=1 Tax=Arabidopsis suecica TaxID=45249 RepID=A0A8T1YNJ1_ARASU|nr:hypothetical protein ISN44_As12g030180 [Arabidopsis suecica]
MWNPLRKVAVAALQVVSESNPDECEVKMAHTVGGDDLGAQRGRYDLLVGFLKTVKVVFFESNCALKSESESEISLKSSSRSLEFRCFAILIDYKPHRISQPATSEVAMKLTAEELTLIQLMLFSEGLGPRSSQPRPIYKIDAPTHLAY